MFFKLIETDPSWLLRGILKLLLKLLIAKQAKTSEKSSKLILLICRKMRQFVFDLRNGHDGNLPEIAASRKFQSPNAKLSYPERGTKFDWM
jgi:hypothetical protein